jgi:hypothetical protein
MAWKQDRLARKRVYPLDNGFLQLIETSSGKISSSAGSHKQRVSGKHHSLLFGSSLKIEANTAGRVSRRMNYLERDISDFDNIAVGYHNIRLGRKFGSEHPQHCRINIAHPGRVVLVNNYFRAGSLDHFLVAHNVVDVVMRVDDVLDRQPVKRGFLQKQIMIGGGIDKKSFFRFFVRDQITENIKITYLKLFYQHQSISFI